jgi:phosphoribosylformylglycinamidine synthase
LVLAPDALSRESVIRVYDHEVMGRTAIKPLHGRIETPTHGDAAVLRPRPDRWAGLAIAVAANPWAGRIDSERAAELVAEEAARNLYAVGARPDALADCLNFANPEDPYVLGDFAASLRGLARAARALGFAIPSGNVSFYNAAGGEGIPPTPVLLAVGLVDDVRRAVTADFKGAGNPVYLVGRSSDALGGSLWARRAGRNGLPLPPSDPSAVGRLGRALLAARREVRAVHDVADGGLAVALAEMAFGGGLGFAVDLAATGLAAPGVAAAAEGASRWVVEVDAEREAAFRRRFARLPAVRLGRVESEPVARFRWEEREVGRVDLLALYPRWRTGLEALGPTAGDLDARGG